MDSFIAIKKRIPVKLKTPLAHNFGFDHGDLQDNRSGFISHWQKSRLRWYVLNYTISIIVWLFMLTVFPLGLTAGNAALSSLAMLWAAAVFVIFGMIWLLKLYSVFRDVRAGNVSDLIAPVKHVRQARGRRKLNAKRGTYQHTDMDYFVSINNERFITSQEQMESFSEGRYYHIYVASKSRQILSAELLKQDEIDEATTFLFDEAKIPDYLVDYDEVNHKEKRKR